MRIVRSMPHRLLRLPAVLHREAELGLHFLLQHSTLQRAQEEAARSLDGNAQPTNEHHPRSPSFASFSVASPARLFNLNHGIGDGFY